jgi:hypothetical protein
MRKRLISIFFDFFWVSHTEIKNYDDYVTSTKIQIKKKLKFHNRSWLLYPAAVASPNCDETPPQNRLLSNRKAKGVGKRREQALAPPL